MKQKTFNKKLSLNKKTIAQIKGGSSGENPMEPTPTYQLVSCNTVCYTIYYNQQCNPWACDTGGNS